MKKERLAKMKLGWFVGDFDPTCLRTKSCEAACKYYKAGDAETKHIHKVATEVTLIVSGCAKMNDQVYGAGDIIVLEPGDPTDFTALEDTLTMVVKVPCMPGDKYPA